MGNHLIIGLGGTGGKIIRSMRKMIYQNLRREDPENVNIRYLYVDSDDSLMGIDDESWKTLGRSVQLPQSSKLLIAGMGLQSVIDNVNDYPGIRPWIGDRHQWRSILGSARGAQIAGGQKRRLGRFLFANKVEDFNKLVGKLVREMTDSGQTGIKFHVCCGLAGGTGSGTVVDAVTQLRAKFGSDKSKRIFIYALLPERQPNPDWAGPNYHANGYAALLELNALAVDAWRPHDISGQRVTQSEFNVEAKRLQVQDPFNGCYLFTDENAAGYRANVDRELPDIAASFLYHKIITAADIGESGLNNLSRQERFEMQGGARGVEGEREHEDGPSTRSGRFFTFGIKQLAYPEEEILEYLTFSFAEQAALQLRFNNWSEAVGYADEPRNQSFDAEIRSKETQNRWRITDSHLTLSEGILEDERENARWKSIEADWSNAASNYLLLVQESGNKEQWADKLDQRFEKRFADEFRGQGVSTFYAQRRRIRKRYLSEIRGIIERELFDKWITGSQSMQELSQMLTDLRRELEERHREMDGRIAQQQEIAETYLERANANDAEWGKVGVLSSWVLNKYEKLLKAKAQNLERHYVARTRIEALQFAKSLLGALLDELDDLKGEVDRAASTLTQAIDRFRDEVAARINDEGAKDLEKQVIRFYDPAAVRELSTRLVKDRDVQATQTAQMRQRVADLVGREPTFAKFNENASLGNLVDLFQKQGAENAQTAHDSALAEGGKALLGVSIIDRLYERFGSDRERLELYIDRVVKQAQTFARFSSEEKAKQVPSRAKDFITFTFILPDTKDHPEFAEALEEALKQAVPSGAAAEVAISPQRKNEIVILNVASSFPVRFLKPVEFLKERYEARKASSDSAALEIHLEGDGSAFPRLYQPSVEEIRREARPYLLLARALGLFTVEEDRAGKPSLVYEVVDEDGLPIEEVSLGHSLLEAEQHLDLKLAATIREAVEERLKQPEFDAADTRKEVFQRVVERAKGIKELARDGAYEAYAEGAREAKRVLQLA